MTRALLALIIISLAASVALAQDAPPAGGGPEMVELTPPLSDDILFNPRMGLYLQYPPLDAQPDEWFMDISDIAYYRVDWAELNPEEGVYAFEEYFGPRFDFWVNQHGKRVAFRVMCQNMHSARRYVTPQWVFDRGVPGVTHISLRGEEQINPAFWDERYLDIHCEFIRRLGDWLDGREGLEFVDIGSIGEWGEMHLARWTPEQFAETGYSHTRYVMAHRRVIDTFREAFGRTMIFLNVGGQRNHTINDYAAINGMHFRQDGLNPAGASYDCGEWLYKPYARRGVLCNFEFHSGYAEMQRKGWDLPTTIDRGLDAPISYLNTNLGNYRTLPEEAREEIIRAGRRVGYRFVLATLQHPAQFRLDGARPARVPLLSTWRNDGVAPCYDSFALEWTLVGAQGEAVASELLFPAVPTTQWWPGEEQQVSAMLRVPADTPPGDYRLRVALIVPETGRRILLGIAGRDDEDSYELCTLPGVRAEAGEAVVYEEGFEGEDATPWNPTTGMETAVDGGAARSGEASLLVTGTNEQGWNYAAFRVPTPAVGGGLYRLSAWMLVEGIEPALARCAPYLKIGVNDAEGRWFENHGSNRYDLGRIGEWQELVVTADLPLQAASLDLAIEKGEYHTPITVRLRLDDVRLELVEAP